MRYRAIPALLLILIAPAHADTLPDGALLREHQSIVQQRDEKRTNREALTAEIARRQAEVERQVGELQAQVDTLTRELVGLDAREELLNRFSEDAVRERERAGRANLAFPKVVTEGSAMDATGAQ